MTRATLAGGLLVWTLSALASAQHVTVVNPAAQGMSSAALEQFQRLARKEVELMTTNQLPGDFRPGWGYGCGVQVCTDVDRSNEPGSVGSFGWGGGGNTFFFVDPQQDLIAMVWTQFSGKTTISREFRAAVYRSLASQAQADVSLSE